MTAVLALESVTFRYASEPVLDRLSLSVADGEILALLGPSGSGKSTVLRLLLGFEAPLSGRVTVGGSLVGRDGAILVPPEERNLSVVFQDLALWPHLSVRASLAFGLDARGVPRSERDERIHEMLLRVGLETKADRRPGALSGGEQQRAAIARALVTDPRAILLDEPLANLDAHRKKQLLALFRTIFEERRKSVLYVTHDLREAAAIADRIAVLEEGSIVQDGRLEELRARPATAFIRTVLADLTWSGER